jgi:hypothetical protein
VGREADRGLLHKASACGGCCTALEGRHRRPTAQHGPSPMRTAVAPGLTQFSPSHDVLLVMQCVRVIHGCVWEEVACCGSYVLPWAAAAMPRST